MYRLFQNLCTNLYPEVNSLLVSKVDNITELEEGLMKNEIIKNNASYLKLVRKEEIKNGEHFNLIQPILDNDKLEKGYNKKYYIINSSSCKIYTKTI